MARRATLAVLFALGLSASAYAQVGGKLTWSQDPVADAIAAAARDHKPAMVYFYADW